MTEQNPQPQQSLSPEELAGHIAAAEALHSELRRRLDETDDQAATR